MRTVGAKDRSRSKPTPAAKPATANANTRPMKYSIPVLQACYVIDLTSILRSLLQAADTLTISASGPKSAARDAIRPVADQLLCTGSIQSAPASPFEGGVPIIQSGVYN